MAPAAGTRAFELKEGRGQRGDPDAAGLRVPHPDRQAGCAYAVARRGQSARARGRGEAEGRRDGETEGGVSGRRGSRPATSRPPRRRRASRSRPPSSSPRGAPIADAGVSPAIDAVAFALPAGGVSDPIVTDNGAVVVKVVERAGVSDAGSGERARRRAHGTARRAAKPVLQRLHDQGARADADQRQPAGDRAAAGVVPPITPTAVAAGVPPITPAALAPGSSHPGGHRTKTFGINASGSPRLNTWSGAIRVCSPRASLSPRSAPSVVAPSDRPNGLAIIS